jgi:hypothetical protein
MATISIGDSFWQCPHLIDPVNRFSFDIATFYKLNSFHAHHPDPTLPGLPVISEKMRISIMRDRILPRLFTEGKNQRQASTKE